MNKSAMSVLQAINEASPNGETVIIEKEELQEALPPEDSFVDIDAIIKELTLLELVQLKYKDGSLYALTPLPKGKLITENEKTKVLETSFNLKIDYKRIGKLVFKYSFLGALLAGVITAILIFSAILIKDIYGA